MTLYGTLPYIPNLNIEMSSTDELNWSGQDKEKGVLQGQAGQQAAQVRVLVVLGAHVHHEVYHDHLKNKGHHINTGSVF